MTQILPYPLWVGHAGEGREYRQVFDAGIKVLVQLAAEELPSQPPRELIFCRFPLLDGPGNRPEMLSLAISTVVNLLRRHLPTLISCGAGMSRSPAIAAAALAIVHKLPAEEVLERVVRHHPSDVSPALWNDVKGILDSIA
jgi:protein-tyrosine phosphatase